MINIGQYTVDKINIWFEKHPEERKFMDDFVKQDVNGFITKSDFHKKFADWCIENRHRKLSERGLSMKMSDKGIESGKKHFDWLYDGKGGDARIWLGIIWKL